MINETIEEASWKYNPRKKLDGEFIRHAFIEGAKWQEERMYSKDDLISLLDFVNDRLPDLYSRFSPEEELEDWFEQFKKIR